MTTVTLPVALIATLRDGQLSELFYSALSLATEDSPAEYDLTLKALAREIVKRGHSTYTDVCIIDALDVLDGDV
jgi:hypothetical protein